MVQPHEPCWLLNGVLGWVNAQATVTVGNSNSKGTVIGSLWWQPFVEPRVSYNAVNGDTGVLQDKAGRLGGWGAVHSRIAVSTCVSRIQVSESHCMARCATVQACPQVCMDKWWSNHRPGLPTVALNKWQQCMFTSVLLQSPQPLLGVINSFLTPEPCYAHIIPSMEACPNPTTCHDSPSSPVPTFAVRVCTVRPPAALSPHT